MKKTDPSDLTDQQLLDKAKKDNSTSIINAVLIGLFIGVIVWGVAKNNIGFFGLIVLFFAYKFFNRSKED
ncbi:MAG: hypothetical protein ACI86M_002365 [Saprospiraceae bacterium]|jgi:hypothetical protein